MQFIKCDGDELEKVTAFYRKIVRHLEETVNYPLWAEDHPSAQSVMKAVERGEQYALVSKGEIIGAVVLSEDPEGDYGAGDWSKELNEGEYLVIHALAVDPSYAGAGMGKYLTECCIKHAKENAYKAVRLDVVPTNVPATRLYKHMGFCHAGTIDLKRGIERVPVFDLYELDITVK